MSEEAPFDHREALRGMAPFSRLGGSVLRSVLRLPAVVSLRRGKAICYQGDRAGSAFLILSGSVRAVMYRSDESSIDLGKSGRGVWIGVAEILLDSPYMTDSIAEETCVLLSFSRTAFDGLLRIPEVNDFILRELARRCCILHGRVSLNLPLGRLVNYLLSESAPAPAGKGSLIVSKTQEEIAEAIGVTRETVNKHLGLLQSRGLISIGRGSITLIKPADLRECPD